MSAKNQRLNQPDSQLHTPAGNGAEDPMSHFPGPFCRLRSLPSDLFVGDQSHPYPELYLVRQFSSRLKVGL